MVGFEGISNTHPPSRLVTIDVEDNPTTVRMLHYSVPLKGALDHTDVHQTMKIVIIRSLKDILSGKNNLESAKYEMLNFQAQLPTLTQLQQHLHLDLVQRMILILENVHKMLSKSTKVTSMIYFQDLKQHFVV